MLLKKKQFTDIPLKVIRIYIEKLSIITIIFYTKCRWWKMETEIKRYFLLYFSFYVFSN